LHCEGASRRTYGVEATPHFQTLTRRIYGVEATPSFEFMRAQRLAMVYFGA
jgi:hypothetical protein